MNIFRKRTPIEQEPAPKSAEPTAAAQASVDWQDAEREADRLIAEKAARRARGEDEDGITVKRFMGLDEFDLDDATDSGPEDRMPAGTQAKIATIRPTATRVRARPQRGVQGESGPLRRPARDEEADARIAKLRQQFIEEDDRAEDAPDNSPFPLREEQRVRPVDQADAFVASVQQQRDRATRPAAPQPAAPVVPIAEPVAEMAPPQPEPAAEMFKVPTPSAGRSGARAGRVKTRLLGFEPGGETAPNPFDNNAAETGAKPAMFPVGWLIVTDGPGRGASFTLFSGVSQIGRGDDQTVSLDFGDTSISRSGHAMVAYDPELKQFFIGHGGKTNIVRLNNKPVLSTEELSHGDQVRLGETTLKFVALCGSDFAWATDPQDKGKDDGAQ
ncbi:FHA domain-containing protein [Actibacterium sp. XHP0104]|uniref:FHA domain-containing protein n=1 Tax=Actibacterium sp. XHP0104 TaxID=2984335 RepID=UPI0021E75B71|nr:FHA domain-containing protein [Actibacterium sp. XHP0104]MCV2882959.1 FHA domain-containing protein [Actibacterium sp. XHP0104]